MRESKKRTETKKKGRALSETRTQEETDDHTTETTDCPGRRSPEINQRRPTEPKDEGRESGEGMEEEREERRQEPRENVTKN